MISFVVLLSSSESAGSTCDVIYEIHFKTNKLKTLAG
jgi:hypothetical protein